MLYAVLLLVMDAANNIKVLARLNRAFTPSTEKAMPDNSGYCTILCMLKFLQTPSRKPGQSDAESATLLSALAPVKHPGQAGFQLWCADLPWASLSNRCDTSSPAL